MTGCIITSADLTGCWPTKAYELFGAERNIEINIDWNRTLLWDKEKKIIKPYYSWSNLNRRNVSKNNLFMIYSYFEDVKKYKWNNFDEEVINERYNNIYNYCYSFKEILKSRKGANFKPYFRKGNNLSFSNPMPDVPFNKPKICFTTKWNYKFCYNEIPLYWTWWGLWWLSYIYIDEKNPITETVRKFSNDADYLKFVNVILNSNLMKNFLQSNNFNTLSLDKIREIINIPKIDFENQEDMKKYNEIVDIANQLIQLEKEEDCGISLKKKWEDDILDTNWEEFKNLINSKNYELVNSPIWLEIKNWWNQYIIIWWDSDDILSRYSEWDKTIWELLWIRFSNDKEKEEKKKQLNQRIDEIVDEFYKSE